MLVVLLGAAGRARAEDKPAATAGVLANPATSPLPAAEATPPAPEQTPSALPPAGGSPPTGYPPAQPFGYPPGYGYPPPAYPQGYPAYPYAYPPAQPQSPPDAGPPAPPTPEPPAPLPTGRWRLGGSLVLFPQGYLSFDHRLGGESIDNYARSTISSPGIAGFAEVDLVRYLYLGLAAQFLPWVEWTQPEGSSARGSTWGGSAREFDLLPHIGLAFATSPRLRIFGYLGAGYSLLDASAVTGPQYIELETMHGFVVQTGGGARFAVGEHGFFAVRGSYQRGYHGQEERSPTTGLSSEARLRSSFIGLHGSAGYWF